LKEFILNRRNLFVSINLLIHYFLLFGIIWSVVRPKKRIWPPPKKNSWQYKLTWVCFYLAFLFNGIIIFVDWNRWIIKDNARIFVGFPLILIGSWICAWGISTLGVENTSGMASGFIKKGPYHFTRNPQYLGDIFIFAGLVLVTNSLYLLVFNFLLILVFLIIPFAEEVWLEKQYGKKYIEYKERTARFL
jgi:protein-S-isoprenylcysteine O-methyltransferase Ste14